MTRLARCLLFAGSIVLSACAGDAARSDSPQAEVPSPARRTAIEWSAVPALLRSGRVVAIVQLHDLTVTLITREGEEFVTREPALDDILAAIRDHAPNADSIVRATE